MLLLIYHIQNIYLRAETMPDLLLIIPALIYAAAVVLITAALILYRPPVSGVRPFVTVLIPARNESANIGSCLEGVSRQSYDPDRFEVIVIDDRSTDDTSQIALSYKSKIRNLSVITIENVPAGVAPKKHALSAGVAMSKGEIILCTDADCRQQPQWMEKMISCFGNQTGMVVGYCPIIPENRLSLMHHFSALDGLALAALACATTFINRTATAAGRSLAYRKSAFTEVGGYSKIASFISGDDDLLMHLFRTTSWKTAYCAYPEARVETGPPESLKQFFNQKIRHASKSRHYGIKMILTLTFVYLFNAMIAVAAPILLILYPEKWLWILTPLMIKIFIDGFFLAAAAARFRNWSSFLLYPVVALIHPYYVTVFGLLGLFVKFEWKDSRFSTTLPLK